MTSDTAINSAERDAVWLTAIVQTRDASALASLFEIYGPKLKAWLVQRGASAQTAEDMLQDVMIKVWTRADKFDATKASFATWLYRVTRNCWIDHNRKHNRTDVRDPEIMKVIVDEEVPSAEFSYISQESSQILKDHIQLLSEVQQKAIQMAFMEFKTYQEISEETGLPLGTVKTRIRSAIQTLKTNMPRHLGSV